MTATLKRALAVGTAAMLAFLGLLAVPIAHSAPAVTPTTCAGVWEVVQSDETKPSTATIGCAASYSTGLAALQSSGYAATVSSGMVTQIDGLPTNPDWTTNGNLWWSYWHAPVNADGTIGAWTQYMVGADTSTPAKGTVEGWLLTVAGASGPAVTRLFTPAASSSAPASSSGPASSSAPASSSPASSSPASSSPASSSPATSAPVLSASAVKAASYLTKNLPTVDDGTGAFVDSALALAATRSCDYAGTVAALVASIKTQAVDYVGTDPGRAASLAILASAVGENPKSFAGLDLLSILAAGTAADGQVGSYPSSYVQALAVIAYVRAGQPVPAAVLANLVAGQDSTGAFGYTYGGTFYPDYDTTGLALMALHAAHADSTVIAKAVAWAQSEQTTAGYWPNPYSPVDSTGLLGAGLELVGASAGNALAWLTTQQLADGGFPASLNGTTSNVSATADAMWLLTGTNLVSVSLVTCTATTATPTVRVTTGTSTAVTLADTGSDVEGIVGLLAIATLVAGAALLLVRRRQHQA